MLLRRVIAHVRAQNWLAVGLDFLIVIVGVVIAFQITAWNEERGLRERERIYLEQILIDLESDRATGQRGVVSADSIDAAANTLLVVLEGRPEADQISDADIVRFLAFAGYAYLPYVNSTTYQEMISTGALGLIRDVDLKRALGEYYERAASGRQWDGLLREEQYAYRAAIRGLLTREQFAWARANGSAPPGTVGAPPRFDRAAFIERARSRPEIGDSLRSMGAVQERLRADSRDLAAFSEALSARVRAQLEAT